jgi:hypothetical protein
MKLLFNHNTNKGNEELKELIGHIDKDIKFDKLKSDLITATNDIIKIIGQPMYDSVVSKYQADGEPSEADALLIYYVRYPIALDGYRHHAKASDVSHTNNGRKIRMDDHNKLPFEWLLDRDNEEFERKYYKAIDDLIDYLDENSVIWKASAAYKESQKYFVRLTSDFDEYFPIKSRLLLQKLQPGFRQCERKHIIPIISSELSSELKTKLKDGIALNETESQLLELIKEACVFFSLSWGIRVLRVTLFPEGVLQRFAPDSMTTKASQPPLKLEAELAAQEFKKRAVEVLQDIQQSISVSHPETATSEELNEMSDPDFKFDDDDAFVSL